MSCDIGVYGMGVIGRNLALNIASKGFNVAVSNRSPAKVCKRNRLHIQVEECIKRSQEEHLGEKVFASTSVRLLLSFYK